ncbi:hypothetical protein MPTK1_7g07620 [Marchantia polymorpha subsp. ruderalis]|uniref:Uncharacterized protein n=2 Tax=Marchantia polymorpha TaxID=3197 RepID=A0AAF6BX56_MARPO|nr:hypothetical protein MARPO_0076s0032 [Marchantia polymorpha]BBN16590.1 hypothetical protein Mp_7g07620 [Marchantia polymorpha subsp. ruderalis]|eukprot:PTQ34787.1 hypothetical protein MARPO_0076s0032 [Marchantia polymorpha]
MNESSPLCPVVPLALLCPILATKYHSSVNCNIVFARLLLFYLQGFSDGKRHGIAPF